MSPLEVPGRAGWASGPARLALYALSVIVGLALLSAALNALLPSQHGPPSSSYATTPAGLAAYAELLARAGHPVAQLRRPPARGVLAPGETVVLLDPDALLGAQGRALAAFVGAGGRLVTGGSSANSFLATILSKAPRWVPGAPRTATPLGSAPETAAVATVATLGQGGWSASAAAPGLRPVLGRPGAAPVLLAGPIGRGRIALLADSSPLQNRLLASADNARLGLDLAGPAGRPVVFVESVHGYGLARGLAALPARWWWSVGGLTLAALAWVLGRWRRLGPPAARGRTLPPARSAYLQAMTTILRRADDPAEAAAIARATGRRLVARRLRLAAEAGNAERVAAARRLGLSQEQASLLADDRPSVPGDLLALVTALARLHAGRSPASDLDAGRRR